MTFKSTRIGRVYLLRWAEVLPSDLDRVLSDLDVFGKTLGRRPTYIAIVPVDSAPPSAEARKAMMAKMPAISELCETVHVVMEGRGLKFTAQRSAAAAMFLLAGTRKIFTHDVIADALTKAGLADDEKAAVLANGQLGGLLTGTGAAVMPVARR